VPPFAYAWRMSQPTKAALAWTTSALSAQVIGVKNLHGGPGPWLLRLSPGGRFDEVVLRTGETGRPDVSAQFQAEAAALVQAADHALPAPRLIAADLAGDEAEALAVLATVVAGSSRIPVSPTPARMRALGAGAAALHAVPMEPRPGLPLRDRPIADMDFAALRREFGLSALFEEAEQAVAQAPEVLGGTVFVHGDLWQGNTIWNGDTLTGLVDWDSAGAGHYGVDLGSLRCDAAVMFGGQAADEVLKGWRSASIHDDDNPHTIAYWDVMAALSTPPDMADVLGVFADQGRDDLHAALVNERRDTFLRTALNRLG